jgi:hypothetical protein
MSIKGTLYRSLMRVAHKYNWHHAPPCYPDGDTQLWCQWCGFRETIKTRGTNELGAMIPLAYKGRVPPQALLEED